MTVREDAWDIISAGIAAVRTADVVRRSVRLDGDTLHVGGRTYDLRAYRDIHVIGFGKASCEASMVLESLLDGRVTRGISIGTETRTCRAIDLCEATHPLPSAQNVELTGRLVRECESITKDDLVLVVVSGGGSAMLCWPASECDQGTRLYDAANRAGMSITELNTVRKHISALKGGGLAKLLYPATVVALIFSDVPGGHDDIVASGPTYPDHTTVADARAVIETYGLGEFELQETPKDARYFDAVTNIVVVSNRDALSAMASRATALAYTPTVIGTDFYDAPERIVSRMRNAASPHSAVIAGGESSYAVPAEHGVGGRNQHVALTASLVLRPGQVFAAVASDGRDNGPHGGAIVDAGTVSRAGDMDAEDHLRRCDETALLARAGDLVEMEPTGANVSDLYLLLTG